MRSARYAAAVAGAATGSGPASRMAANSGGRDQLVFDGAPLPAALDPDVAGAQPVAQSQQCRRLPDSALELPSAPSTASRQAGRRKLVGRAARPFPAAAGRKFRAAARPRAAWRPRLARLGVGKRRGTAARAGAAPARRARQEPADRLCPGRARRSASVDAARQLVPADRRGHCLIAGRRRCSVPRSAPRPAWPAGAPCR